MLLISYYIIQDWVWNWMAWNVLKYSCYSYLIKLYFNKLPSLCSLLYMIPSFIWFEFFSFWSAKLVNRFRILEWYFEIWVLVYPINDTMGLLWNFLCELSKERKISKYKYRHCQKYLGEKFVLPWNFSILERIYLCHKSYQKIYFPVWSSNWTCKWKYKKSQLLYFLCLIIFWSACWS